MQELARFRKDHPEYAGADDDDLVDLIKSLAHLDDVFNKQRS